MGSRWGPGGVPVGYWESHERSAPRSTMPIRISKIVIASPALAPALAYWIAVSLSEVVDEKPYLGGSRARSRACVHQ